MTDNQILAIGSLALILAQLFKIVFSRAGYPVDRRWITGFMIVVAVAMAYIWARPALPIFPSYSGDAEIYAGQVAEWLEKMIAVVSAVVGFATLIYNLLAQKIFDNLGWNGKTPSQSGGVIEVPLPPGIWGDVKPQKLEILHWEPYSTEQTPEKPGDNPPPGAG